MEKISGSRPARRAIRMTAGYEEVEARLPRLMRLAFDAYCVRAAAAEGDNVKEFVAGQAACRAALAHFMLLLRLSDRLSRQNKTSQCSQDEEIENIIFEARSALARDG